MVVFNDVEIVHGPDLTIAEIMIEMQHKKRMGKEAQLVTLNGKLVSPSDYSSVKIHDGDIIKTRRLPCGG